MRRVLISFVGIFLFAIAAFTILNLGKHYSVYPEQELLGQAVGQAIVSAFVLSLVVSAVLCFAEFMQKGEKVKQSRCLQVLGDFDAVFDTCRDAIERLPQGVRFLKVDRKSGKLDAKTRIAWNKGTCRVSVLLSSLDDAPVKVTIDSRPAWMTAAYDFRANHKNVQQIVRYLKDRLDVRETGA